MAFHASSSEPLPSPPHPLYETHAFVIDLDHPRRRDAEKLIEDVYQAAFNARLRQHFPTLLGVADASGDLVAAAGCRFADRCQLFLESYLDEPVEALLTQRQKHRVLRRHIAEIGSLATAAPGHILPLFAALAHHLHEAGSVYAVATATGRLRRAFAALGFCDGELAKARAHRISGGQTDWGEYYEHAPAVVFGRVAEGRARLESAKARALR